MRVRITKRADGKFDVLTEPGRRSGLPKKLFQAAKKEEIADLVAPILVASDEEKAARRLIREQGKGT